MDYLALGSGAAALAAGIGLGLRIARRSAARPGAGGDGVPLASPDPGAGRAAGRRELSAFEAGVANVINLLNNRLSAIIAFGELVNVPQLGPTDREALDAMRAEARKAAQTVRDLIQLVQQPGTGEGSTHLPTALEEVLALEQDTLRSDAIEVHLDLESSVSLVAGRQANIVNLFTRLLKFAQARLLDAPEPRRVTWVARQLGAGLVVTQTDSGPTLPVQLAPPQLDYFRPADPYFPGHVELTLAQRVAENCGAGLRVGPGEAGGAEVTVTLIPGALLEPPLPRARRDAAPLTGGRILVADDDEANRRALALLLGKYGHEVTVAADGVEALVALEQRPFDAVVVDLQMPRVGGREVYERTATRSPALARRFVFVTGDDSRAASQGFLRQVQQPTVRKPYEISDLLAAIGEVARRS
jgi:two-component system NtrC family sensor kinase